MTVTMIPLSSRVIKSTGYDAETKTLYVEFKTGVVYLYTNVPKEKFDKMLIPTIHVGKYFHEEIATPDQLYSKTPYQVVNGQLTQI
jgi:hypothetical protein